MADVDALKSEARQAEAQGDYGRATKLYLRAISTAETDQIMPDPGMLVRVADLEHRQGDRDGALTYYRRAVKLYAEQGLLTNAVAVCNKVLRVYPEHHPARARLAQLHLDLGLTADARRHALEYEAAITETGGASDGLESLRSFLDREPDTEVAIRLADRYAKGGRTDEALEVLEAVARDRLAEGLEVGDLAQKARALDPDADPASWRRPSAETGEDASTEASGATSGAASPEPARGSLGELGVLEAAGEEAADQIGMVEREGQPSDRDGEAGPESAHMGVLQTLASLVEHRDYEAEWHAERVGELTVRLAEELGLSPGEIEMLEDAAPLHDIGMVVVPDRVLLKDGELTEEERDIMMSHAENGARILSSSDLPVMQLAGEIALTHHEQWDGEGYPRGLAGGDIPLSGRIVAVADAFEAYTNDRPYRRATSTENTLEVIEEHSGTRYDPRIVDALLEVQDDLAEEDADLLRTL